MQFLQTDLLEMIRQEKMPAPLPLLRKKPDLPRQSSLLIDIPPALKKSGKTSEATEEKSAAAFKTISEAAEILGVPAYVLRFWESQFTHIKPTKSRGGRRYYRPEDMEMLASIKTLLYKEGYTIKGARKALAGMKDDVLLASKPVPIQKPKPAISDKQKAQLTKIKDDLLELREELVGFCNP